MANDFECEIKSLRIQVEQLEKIKKVKGNLRKIYIKINLVEDFLHFIKVHKRKQQQQ